MAKRFTDTDKWKKSSYMALPLKMKMAWGYLCDNCDHAGIWEVNMPLMSLQMGEKVTITELKQHFSDKLEWIGADKVFIASFVEFQYGQLNPGNNAHKGVISKLEKLKVLKEPLKSPSRGAQETDKDKDKEMDKEKGGEIPFGILNTIKMQCGFPDDVIEEHRKKAWLAYQGSQNPTKNWTQYVANYFSNNQEKIRRTILDKDQASKPANKPDSDLVAMSERIYTTVKSYGLHDYKNMLANLSTQEKRALDLFGSVRDIHENQLVEQVKKRLREACAQSLRENIPRAG